MPQEETPKMQPTQEAALDEQAQKLVQLREKANKTKKLKEKISAYSLRKFDELK